MAPNTTVPKPRRRGRILLSVLGVLVAAIAVFLLVFRWDWLLPIVEARASKAIGRTVTAEHLHVTLGRTTTAELDNVVVANPEGFPADPPFARAAKLTIQADVMAYIRDRVIVIPQITLDQPVVEAVQSGDGKATWDLPALQSKPGDPPSDPAKAPKIGRLTINDGKAHVLIPKLKSDFNLDVASADGTDGKPSIVVGGKGTYAGQPITAKLVAGAVLSLRDAKDPYPIDLQLANGPTKVSLVGTVQNPLDFAGADLKLHLSGPDMAKLTPLTGVPIPQTPPYDIAGKLDYADRKIRFTGFTGKLGSSDLNGDIAVDPTGAKTAVDANLVSHRVDLADLGGFIGEPPGREGQQQTAEQKREMANKEASPRILPNTPIDLPKVDMANVHLKYRGEHLQGRSIPFDNIAFTLVTTDGRIQVEPLTFAVGKGEIALGADLQPDGKNVRAKVKVDFKRVDLGRMLEATHLVNGGGSISGTATLNSVGDSIATLLGRGDGSLRLGLSGGNLSALLVDLAGLQFGDALLSALGIPNRAQLRCFVGDFSLVRGMLQTKTLLLDTSEARIQATGAANLANESLDFKLTTDARHFSVGNLSTPIDIGGTMKHPSVAPEAGPLAAKAGAAVGLGILFPPAALIPTIQFGIGEDNVCQQKEAPIAAGQASAAAPRAARPTSRRRRR